MTKLESIVGSRAWKGAKIEDVEWQGQQALKLTHPSGATAVIYRFAGSIQVRHWDAYMEMIRAKECQAMLRSKVSERDMFKQVWKFQRLSGFQIEGILP